MNQKIMIVGDLHGNWGSLNHLINHKRPNIVLQVGDFGWWPMLDGQNEIKHNVHSPIWNLKGVKLPESVVLYWCDGNHEDHEHLLNSPIAEINYNGVTYMPRGSILQLPDGRTVMFIGGADSIDKAWRTPRWNWFHEEVISNNDLDKCCAYEGQVDIIISHTAPIEFPVRCNDGSEGKYDDPSRRALSYVLDRFKPDLWYFGHWHKEQSGKYNNTYWQCLDYPKHGGQWWTWLNK